MKANPAACNLISWHAAATLHAAASFGQFATGKASAQPARARDKVPEGKSRRGGSNTVAGV